jgi:hypothetical protein
MLGYYQVASQLVASWVVLSSIQLVSSYIIRHKKKVAQVTMSEDLKQMF